MQETDTTVKSLQIELKKANREIKRLQRENNILAALAEQANKFREYSEHAKGQQVFYNAMLLQNSPNISIMLDMDLNTVMATEPFYQRSTYSFEQINNGVYIYDLFDYTKQAAMDRGLVYGEYERAAHMLAERREKEAMQKELYDTIPELKLLPEEGDVNTNE